MNGLEIIDLQRGGFADRLFKRRPSENTFIEINNILASVPILQIDRQSITNKLDEYGINSDDAKPRFLSLYSQVLKHFIRDSDLSDQEIEELERLKNIFDLTPDETNQIHSAVVYPIYERAVKAALSDRHLTDSEKSQLEHLQKQLRIPDNIEKDIRTNLAQIAYQQAIDEAVADRLLSPEEEQELEELARNLNAVVGCDYQSQQALERFRYLWRLSEGDLPIVPVPIQLGRNEICAAYLDAQHYQIKTVTKAIRYGGFSASIKIAGPLRYRSGTIRTHRVSEEVMTLLDTGTLYFTNKRLLFHGAKKTTQIPLTKIIDSTFYADGLLVQKDTGKPQIFQFIGDMEELQMIMDTLMSESRA